MKEQGSAAIIDALRKILNGDLYLSGAQSRHFLATMTRSGTVNKTGTGPERLSMRELEVFEVVGRGFNSAEIARKLHISARTVETHRTHIKVKLGHRTRAEMLHAAIRWVESGHQVVPPSIPERKAPTPGAHRKQAQAPTPAPWIRRLPPMGGGPGFV